MKQIGVENHFKTKWHDIINEKEKIIASYKIINKFTIKIQHTAEENELWFLSITGIYDHEYLGKGELNEAKKEALRIFEKELRITLGMFEENMKRTKWKK